MQSGMAFLKPQVKTKIPLRTFDKRNPDRDWLDLNAEKQGPPAPERGPSRSFLQNALDHKKTADVDSKIATASSRASTATKHADLLNKLAKKHQSAVAMVAQGSKVKLPKFKKPEKKAPAALFSNPIFGRRPVAAEPKAEKRPQMVFRSKAHFDEYQKKNAPASAPSKPRFGLLGKVALQLGQRLANGPAPKQEPLTPPSEPKRMRSGKEIMARYAAMNSRSPK